MALPVLAATQIATAIPDITITGTERRGGQKLVFPCEIAGHPWALKLMLAQPTQPAGVDPADSSVESFDPVTARARREVAIMYECQSPHLVKLGPLPLAQVDIEGQSIIYFTEEWIDGQDLAEILRVDGTLSVEDVRRLGLHIAAAIEELWSKGHIHRDIKPGNIMRREANGDFVLLDMGLAFDLQAQSISSPGTTPGTMIYFSPEQANVARKRQLDFRSDLFALGIVMYEALTSVHPFIAGAATSIEVLGQILGATPAPPSTHRAAITSDFDRVILRLLAKSPHLRYKTCERFRAALTTARGGGVP